MRSLFTTYVHQSKTSWLNPRFSLICKIAPSIFVKSTRFLTTHTTSRTLFLKQPVTPANDLQGKEMVFSATPKFGEKKHAFCARVQNEITEKLVEKAGANQMVIISYATRLAAEDEKIANVAYLFDPKNYPQIDLPLVDKTLFPGHCLLTTTNAEGKFQEEYTVSLRPDRTKPRFYKAKTAMDPRLPLSITNIDTSVSHTIHTSVKEEITMWAENAYYIAHVHQKRPKYSLHCIFKPMKAHEQNRLGEAAKQVKLACQRYSLLDHFHPFTGDTAGDIVTGQNCTVITKLIEQINEIDLRNILGNNATPQWVTSVIKSLYFKNANPTEDDEFNKAFTRR